MGNRYLRMSFILINPKHICRNKSYNFDQEKDCRIKFQGVIPVIEMFICGMAKKGWEH